jgi:hypothetical protein
VKGDWLATKLELLSQYQSQVAATDLEAVSRHSERIGGERIWHI